LATRRAQPSTVTRGTIGVDQTGIAIGRFGSKGFTTDIEIDDMLFKERAFSCGQRSETFLGFRLIKAVKVFAWSNRFCSDTARFEGLYTGRTLVRAVGLDRTTVTARTIGCSVATAEA